MRTACRKLTRDALASGSTPLQDRKLASGILSLPSWIASRLDGPEVANDTGKNPSSPLKVAAESCFWTTKDQSRFGGGLNFYAYANDDPVNYIDRTGHNPVLVGIGIIVLYGIFAPSDTAQAPADIGMMAVGATALPGLGVAGVVAAGDVGLVETAVCGADRQAILRSLARGRSAGVRLVESEGELNAIYEKLAQEGTSITPGGYAGTMVEVEGGARIGLRAGSASGGATIDVFESSGAYTKVHIR